MKCQSVFVNRLGRPQGRDGCLAPSDGRFEASTCGAQIIASRYHVHRSLLSLNFNVPCKQEKDAEIASLYRQLEEKDRILERAMAEANLEKLAYVHDVPTTDTIYVRYTRRCECAWLTLRLLRFLCCAPSLIVPIFCKFCCVIFRCHRHTVSEIIHSGFWAGLVITFYGPAHTNFLIISDTK